MAIPFLLSYFTGLQFRLDLRQPGTSGEMATPKAQWMPGLILVSCVSSIPLRVSGLEEELQHNPGHEGGGKV